MQAPLICLLRHAVGTIECGCESRTFMCGRVLVYSACSIVSHHMTCALQAHTNGARPGAMAKRPAARAGRGRGAVASVSMDDLNDAEKAAASKAGRERARRERLNERFAPLFSCNPQCSEGTLLTIEQSNMMICWKKLKAQLSVMHRVAPAPQLQRAVTAA